MDVMEAIKNRRSVRAYSDKPIPAKVIARMRQALRYAPSACNIQPCHFILVEDAKIRQDVATAAKKQDWMAQAPVIVVACGHIKEASALLHEEGGPFVSTGQVIVDEMGAKPGQYTSAAPWDLAIALEHLALAAVEEGLGTCWIGGLDEGELKRVLAIPEGVSAPLLMAVGYPASAWPPPRPRKPLAEIVRYESYGH